MPDIVLARPAALKTVDTRALGEKWRELFDTEPRHHNGRFLEGRLASRIQKLAYGGVRQETVERLDALAEQHFGGNKVMRRIRHGDKPITGTRLIREWKGVKHCVTVLDDGHAYMGQPYKSLSSVARANTGTRWNAPDLVEAIIDGRQQEGPNLKAALRGVATKADRKTALTTARLCCWRKRGVEGTKAAI